MKDSQRTLLPYRGAFCPDGSFPCVDSTAFIAPGAVIIGDVTIGAGSSVWYGCVVRGDVNKITIGQNTNIQDGTIIHVTRHTGPTRIGDGVTIGHQVLLHACTLEDHCFVGMSSTIMDGATVQSGGWLAAGALLTPGKTVPTGELWAGSPAKFFRKLTEEEAAFIAESANNYNELAKEHALTLA